MTNPHWIYTQTIKTFAAGAEPAFEDPGELAATWGKVWGIDNDVGRIRDILMHRPGPEMQVVDPAQTPGRDRVVRRSCGGLVFPIRHAARHSPDAAPARCLCRRPAGRGGRGALHGRRGGQPAEAGLYPRSADHGQGRGDRLPDGRAHPAGRGTGGHPHAGAAGHPDPAHDQRDGGDGGRQFRLAVTRRPAPSAWGCG